MPELRARTLKIMAVLVCLYGLALLPALRWPEYLDSPAGVLVLLPYLSVYLFHSLGVPGLLEHNGLCGWGWCAPTPFGWAFVATLWLLVIWGVARGIAGLMDGRSSGTAV